MTALWINLALAFVWLLLSKDPGIGDFLIGYLLGFFLIFLFSRLIRSQGYIRRSFGFASFLFLFLWEFIKSNLQVAYVILFVSKSKIRPDFLNYDIGELTWGEAILLSYCITLTPGTISVKLDTSSSTLLVHVLDCKDVEKIKDSLDKKFKRSILGFTR